VSHPFGDPNLDHTDEVKYRRAVVEKALSALRDPVEAPTVFELGD
jgi:hypothetical protein